ncbi:MAG: hypothetical protein K5821_01160 [Nitrobacter sp.]|nr:hypothetical protein [Nitrobacter sp.]MCV0385035.1 hypothetical protein [Nitrobacter sp.]
MSTGTSGRSALIIAAGLLLGFAGPMRPTGSAAEPAAVAAHTGKAGAPIKLNRSPKHRSHKRQATRTQKSARPESRTDAKAEETMASAIQDSNKHIPLPPTITNANASVQMPPGAEDWSKEESSKTEAGALANSASEMLATNQGDTASSDNTPATPAAAVAIVSPDELNEIDRALAHQQDAPSLALASIDLAPPSDSAETGQPMASGGSAWNQTSLIGKIFIAFGGLLTIGSAARMFMA